MKILVLSWEFPPRIVGGIARHVGELYPEIVTLGHQVHVVTIEHKDSPHYELVEGVHVHRVAVDPHQDFFGWVGNINASLGKHGEKLITEEGDFQIIHAHDWLVGDAAIALKNKFKIPLVTTIHATEHGRHNGIHTQTQQYISNKERNLTHEAWRVIVCTEYMHREVSGVLHTPWEKIDVIYNGIRAEKKQIPPDFDKLAFRRHYATDAEKIVYYVGRMTHEKGVAVLINAAPKVLCQLPNVKFIIIGGGNTDHLKHQAQNLGIWDHCLFTGFMPDQELDRFQSIADCAVFPSLYEPFGIVALESFAARVPVVVSDTCGLTEVVHHNHTGIVTKVNNPDSLAWGILEVLRNPEHSQSLVENALVHLKTRFSWPKLAEQTGAVYQKVIAERAKVNW